MASRIQVPDHVTDTLSRWYEGLPRQVPVLSGSLFGFLFGLAGQHAVTINGSVHWTRNAPALDSDRGIALLGHELFHVVQQRQMGWWPFLARYLLHWRPAHVRRGWEHPYEVPAYQRGREIAESLRS